MFCRKCGNPVNDGAAFCPACGAELSADGNRQAATPPQVYQPTAASPSGTALACPKCGSTNIAVQSTAREGRWFWVYFAVAALVIIALLAVEMTGAGSSGGAASSMSKSMTKIGGISIVMLVWGIWEFLKFRKNSLVSKVRCNQCGKTSKIDS